MSDIFEEDGQEELFAPEQAPRAATLSEAFGLKEHPPLAERLRPTTLDDYFGQQSLIGAEAPLGRLIRSDKVPSMILWGPPGSGKTTLAHIIARASESDFVPLSAVTSSLKDVRAVVDQAKTNRRFNRRTVLFIDEIHRFNKAQQDAFLPHVESGIITLIGATTENPSFTVISPLLSRCRVFVLKPHTEEDLVSLLHRGLALLNRDRKDAPPIGADEEALRAMAALCDGDARRALGILEVAHSVQTTKPEVEPITRAVVEDVVQRHLSYDRTGEEHFNLISALHKTMRSNDPHAAVYYLGRMLAAGEDPRYVARRMIRFASEDVGLADPNALLLANAALAAYERLGSPEGDLALAQCALYLAMAPKSTAAYKAWKAVEEEIGKSGSLPAPLHLRNAPTSLMKNIGYGKGYTYDPDTEGGFTAKQGLPDAIADRRFYSPTGEGWEGKRRELLEEWDRARSARLKDEGGKDEG